MKIQILGTMFLAFFFLSAPAGAASTKQEVQNLKAEVEALKEGQAAIQKNLEEIKSLLEKGAAAAPAAAVFKEQEVTIGLSPYRGEPDAPITLIEFSDYECPFCSRHYRDVMPALISEYVDSGKLKYVIRESPIASIHPHATMASLAALCANNQGNYWEMHDKLFDNQRELNADKIKSLGAEIGLNTEQFNECLDTKKYEPWVNADLQSARDLGVRGTPGFVLGYTDPDDPDKVLMTKYVKGAQPLENFKREIDDLLAGVEDEG